MTLISKKFNEALNEQIKHELESAYIYLSMSVWLKEQSYNNLANWYYIQAQEEFDHAKKFMDHIIECGGTVKLLSIEEPKSDWESVKQIVEAGYEHEQFITNKIMGLVELAEELNERTAKTILQWFVDEQVEEEDSASELITKQAAYKNDMLFDYHIKREEE
ncbi:MAG: ferritin [Candidatus Heimdallarchaeota archaeon]|nr:ferritin [Candidatus Heimdallarchaeota archaeon]